MLVIENENFVVKDTWNDRIAIGNLKTYGEGIYIEEKQIDDLINILNQYKQKQNQS